MLWRQLLFHRAKATRPYSPLEDLTHLQRSSTPRCEPRQPPAGNHCGQGSAHGLTHGGAEQEEREQRASMDQLSLVGLRASRRERARLGRPLSL